MLGNGVAGATLSTLLQRQGIDHVVLDRVMSRPGKAPSLALGETIPPSALPLLDSLGLRSIFEEAAVQRTYGYHSRWGSDRVISLSFFGRSRDGYGLKLDKRALVEQLSRASASHAITYDSPLELRDEGDHYAISVTHDGTRVEVHADVVVDATGRSRAGLRRLGVRSERVDDLLAWSCHVPRRSHPALVHPVYVESFEHGWGLVSVVDDTTNIVSIFTSGRSPVRARLLDYRQWPSILAQTSILRDFVASEPGVRVLGADAASSRPVSFSGARWLAIGDAAFALDPLSSHGITSAVYLAKRAAEALVARREGAGPGAMLAYGRALGSIFDACLVAREQLYRSESRWHDAPFWRSVQGGAGGSKQMQARS